MKKIIVAVLTTAFAGCSALSAATIETNVSEWAFASLLDSANETTKGWFFSSGPIDSSVTLKDVDFSGVNPGGSGSSDILSWSSSDGYQMPQITWTGSSDQTARDAMSQGGIQSNTLSLDIALNAGTEYVIELVGIQPGGWGVRSMDISVDGAQLIDEWTIPNSGVFNSLLRFSGTSDGNIDLDFSSGSTTGDTQPAFSILTVTQIPEPTSIAMLALAAGLGLFIRRRFLI